MSQGGTLKVLVSFVDYVLALLHSSYVGDFLHGIVHCPARTLSTKLQEPEPQPLHQRPIEHYQ